MAAFAVVTWFDTVFHLLLTQGSQPVLAAITAVGLVLLQQLPNHFCVAVETVGLVYRAFIKIEPQPFHPVQDGLHRFRGRPFKIGVFDTQDKNAMVGTRLQPGK